jgi:hypothetical protein
MPDLAAAEENSSQTAFDAVLAKTGAKDRTHVQRHLTALDAEPEPAHAALWRRLAEMMASMAPMPVQAVGHTAVLFFVPDGKYRMQVFSLEDQSDGRLAVYLPDILADALKKKILKKTEEESEFGIVGSLRTTLHVESLDAQNTPEPAVHVKNMLGWNRKSLRVTLPVIGAEGPRIDAVEALCTLASKQWADRLARAAAASPAPPAPAPRATRSEGSKKRTA